MDDVRLLSGVVASDKISGAFKEGASTVGLRLQGCVDPRQ